MFKLSSVVLILTGITHYSNLAQAADSSAQPVAKTLPAALIETEKLYSKAGTLSARFTQLNFLASLPPIPQEFHESQKKMRNENKAKFASTSTLTGTLHYRFPNHFRWEIEKPTPSVTVSDGKKLWIYVESKKGVYGGEYQEKSAADLNDEEAHANNAIMRGAFSALSSVKVTEATATHFILTPSPRPEATIQLYEVDIDPKSHHIERVKIVNKNGNHATFEFSEIRLGHSIDDKQFTFTRPPVDDAPPQNRP